MKKALFIFLGLLGALLGAVVCLYLFIFAFNQRPEGGPSLAETGVERVGGFSGIFVVPVGAKRVALIDAGIDPAGRAVLERLKKEGLGEDAVQAIFITHAHGDHCAGIARFPKAAVYALEKEVGLATQKEAYHSPMSLILHRKIATPFQVTHPLQDGQTVRVGEVDFTAFGLPGHTPGSAAYLAKGILFLGDAAILTKQQRIKGPVWFFSDNAQQGKQALRALGQTLKARQGEVRFLATSHYGNAAGLEPLLQF